MTEQHADAPWANGDYEDPYEDLMPGTDEPVTDFLTRADFDSAEAYEDYMDSLPWLALAVDDYMNSPDVLAIFADSAEDYQQHGSEQ